MGSPNRDVRRATSSRRILLAAQEAFAELGYDGATIRGIAERAGVHASLVMQHYGSKAELFAIAARLSTGDELAAADHLRDVLDARLGELPPETTALVRSMLTVPEAADTMRDFLDERVRNLAGSFAGEDAEVRAVLAVSAILGLTLARHFLRLEAFDSIAHDDLVDAAHAWLSAPAD